MVTLSSWAAPKATDAQPIQLRMKLKASVVFRNNMPSLQRALAEASTLGRLLMHLAQERRGRGRDHEFDHRLCSVPLL